MSLQNIVPYRLPNHKNKRLLDPHVVIVGAGASRAACKIDKNGKEVPNKELEKLLLYSNKSIMQQLLKFIQNDLTTKQIEKFISMKSFEKTFKDKEYQCTFKFIFSSFGDLILEVVKFGKRDMYKEMKQQQFKNLESGIFGNDHSIF